MPLGGTVAMNSFFAVCVGKVPSPKCIDRQLQHQVPVLQDTKDQHVASSSLGLSRIE